MANTTLEIRHYTGDVEERQLSKRQPVTIGRHESNDVRVDDDDVAMMHCRISWNRKHYEVTAANLDGVDVNGTLVRQAILKDGDVIRVGPVDLVLHTAQPAKDRASSEKQPVEQASKSSEVDLKPISESEIFSVQEPGAAAPASRSSEKSENQGPQPEARSTPQPKPNPKRKKSKKDDGKREKRSADAAGNPSERPQSSREDSGESAPGDEEEESGVLPPDLYEDLEGLAEEADPGDDEQVEDRPVLRRSTQYSGGSAVAGRSESGAEAIPLGERLKAFKSQLRPRPSRPGEQDVARSPAVLSLGGGALFLLLAALTIYFVIGRQQVERHYEAAVEEFEQGRYQQALQLFDEFLKEHPYHDYVDSVYIYRGRARVEAAITGSAPDWKRGLSALQEFIRANRDRPNFQEHRETIREYAESIALGAAETAGTAIDRELLAVAEEARQILDRFSPADNPPVETQNEVSKLLRASRDAIVKREAFDAAVADIQQAIQDEQPMAALQARLDLLARYQVFEDDMDALLEEILETERSLVQRDDVDRDARQEDRPTDVPQPLSLTLHARSRTDEVSDGRRVFAVAKDCCYGIDMITGVPAWRRVIGLDTPFFPLIVETSVQGLLVFDTNHQELLLLDRATGDLVWRQPLNEDVAGPPLVHQGQIYLPTANKHLYKIDLASGRVSTRLNFSQTVLAPPVLTDDEQHLVVAGDDALLYTVSLTPLDCVAVSNIGHQAGSVEAPLVKMGALILLAENDRMNSCRLRVLDTRADDNRLVEIGSERVDGHVRDAPVLRGKQLFVPSSPERVAAFTVSDDPSQDPLSVVARHLVPTSHPGPLFLAAGPDGQLWMSGSALRRLRLTTDTLTPEGTEIAAGLSTQPLQMVGRNLFMGRRLPYSQAVVFTQIEREQMVSFWKAVLGADVLSGTAAAGDSFVCVTEQGDVFRLGPNEIESGGFHTRAAAQLNLPETLSSPLQATMLADGRLAVAAGGNQPRFWIVNQLGQIEQQTALEGPLQTAPALLSTGVVLPLPGKLRLIGPRSTGSQAEDYLAPVEQDDAAKWVHVAALDEGHLVALDDEGRLTKIQLRSEPVPNLTSVSSVELGSPVDLPVLISDGRVILADAEGRLQMLGGSSFEPLSEIPLDAPATNLWFPREGTGTEPTGSPGSTQTAAQSSNGGSLTERGNRENRVYVEVGGDRLTCVDPAEDLKMLWTHPFNGVGMAGAPLLHQGGLLVALQDGRLLRMDPETGETTNEIDLGQPLAHGAIPLGSLVVVPAVDGSLYHVEALLE